ncbi:hypothetical protein JD844_026282 [Phrynosoma platyrhinos]|uniref:VWFC domain-containing protein n=1 Tax=Phrynosoma platyrhinos TaxID=52577 RepID=A0ABQ7SEV7_PHRPL|nr:hypothetical protein JD844_026282 [Phrynosoma platyrhinos]
MAKHGTEWTGSGCTTCSCANGEVFCNPKPCLDIPCERSQVKSDSREECCPQCLGSGETCSFDGKIFQDGEEWRFSQCAKCICRNGTVECFTVLCQPVLCNEELVGRADAKFLSVGQAVKNWRRQSKRKGLEKAKGGCDSLCSYGYRGESVIVPAGKCCPECTPKSCSVSGRAYEDEELVHLEGKCCPECISRGRPCVYKEHTKDSGEKWKEDLCHECECWDSEVVCYAQSCPTCPSGSVAVAVPGECCPQCQPGQCHSDCLTCSQSFDRCDNCRDITKKLQNGHCVASCGSGFYEDTGLCLAKEDHAKLILQCETIMILLVRLPEISAVASQS